MFKQYWVDRGSHILLMTIAVIVLSSHLEIWILNLSAYIKYFSFRTCYIYTSSVPHPRSHTFSLQLDECILYRWYIAARISCWFSVTERKRESFFNFSVQSRRTQEFSVSRRLKTKYILFFRKIDIGWVEKATLHTWMWRWMHRRWSIL